MTNYRFNSHEFDGDAPTPSNGSPRYHFPARAYAPALAAFVQCDPSYRNRWMVFTQPRFSFGPPPIWLDYVYPHTVSTVDPLGLQEEEKKKIPTKEEGAAALADLAGELKKLCDKCCTDEVCKAEKCTKKDCEDEASAIQTAIIATWNFNYGRCKKEEKDRIGGYLCWDWAENWTWAIRKMLKVKCWTAKHAAFKYGGGFTAIHASVALWACNQKKKDDCLLYVDDGWLTGDKFIHFPPFPNNPKAPKKEQLWAVWSDDYDVPDKNRTKTPPIVPKTKEE